MLLFTFASQSSSLSRCSWCLHLPYLRRSHLRLRSLSSIFTSNCTQPLASGSANCPAETPNDITSHVPALPDTRAPFQESCETVGLPARSLFLVEPLALKEDASRSSLREGMGSLLRRLTITSPGHLLFF